MRIVPTVGKDPAGPMPVAPGGKMRILFAYAEVRGGGRGEVSWDEHEAVIRRTLTAHLPGAFELDVIPARRAELSAKLGSEAYDIFHFSGHGDVSADGRGSLQLLDARSPRLWADKLAMMTTGKSLRLVVLSACETSAGDFNRPFAVIAEVLVLAGIPAVVANQFPIPDATVATFLGAFYGELLVSGDVDKAMSEGRQKLATDLEHEDLATLEWGVPTLYRHVAASRLFAPNGGQ